VLIPDIFLENAAMKRPVNHACFDLPSGNYGAGPFHVSETRGSEDRTEKFHNIFYPDVPGFNA